VPLPQAVRERMGRGEGTRTVIAGIRPEDFEDAAVAGPEASQRGANFRVKLDVVEAMGAEFYAHFGVKAEHVDSSELQDLRDDASGGETMGHGDETVVVARLSPESRVRSGEEAELWLDASKLHFFDAESGHALTSGGRSDSPASVTTGASTESGSSSAGSRQA
jgi:multiple sugar transport system ATP-binding protein